MARATTSPPKCSRSRPAASWPRVKVKLAGTDYEMSSVMTKDSLDELGIEKGSTVHVVAKAVNVLLVKP